MHKHISKRIGMHRKPTGGTNKHSKHIIAKSRKGKGMHEATGITEMHPKWLHSNTASWALNQITQPQTHQECQCGKA